MRTAALFILFVLLSASAAKADPQVLLLDALKGVKSVHVGSSPLIHTGEEAVFPPSLGTPPSPEKPRFNVGALKAGNPNPHAECTFGFGDVALPNIAKVMITTDGKQLDDSTNDRSVWRPDDNSDFSGLYVAQLVFKPDVTFAVNPTQITHNEGTEYDCKGKRIRVGKTSHCDDQGTVPVGRDHEVKFILTITNPSDSDLVYTVDCTDEMEPLNSPGLLWSDFLAIVNQQLEFVNPSL